MSLREAEIKFHDFLASHDHPLFCKIDRDPSKFHYYKCPHGNSTDARYKFFPDSIAAGYFKCWKCQIEADFCSKQKHEVSHQEWQSHLKRTTEYKRQNELETKRKHSEVATLAKAVFSIASEEQGAEHPYLRLKQVKAYGVRVLTTEDENTQRARCYKGTLLVQASNIDDELVNIERIYLDRETNEYKKRPLKGGQRAGTFYLIGEVIDPCGVICLAEGYATAATIHEVTGYPVATTFSCGNIPLVTKLFRQKYPQVRLVICTDDDRWHDDPELKDAGPKAAKKACEGVKNTTYLLPNFGVLGSLEGELAKLKPTDFNDVLCLLLKQGKTRDDALTEVRRQIQQHLSNGESMAESLKNEKVNPPIEAKQKQPSILYRRLSDIKAIPINWLWKGRIARGKLTIIAGNPGLGKSQLTSSITAIVTTGGKWPVDGTTCAKGGVVILSAEDDPEDTIRPRLEATGANLNKVFFVDSVQEGGDKTSRRSFNLKADLIRLGEMLEDLKIKGELISLIIIDPITAYLGETDSYKNAEVRSLLAPLSELAAKHQIAIIGVSHLNKSGNTDALMRVSGSLAFVAAARAAFLVAQDDEDENKRLFLPLKNNIGNDKTGLSFRIEPHQLENGIEISRIIWADETVLKTANDVMATQYQNDKDAKAEAEEFLCDLLYDGAKPVKEIKKESEDAGHAWATIRRAKNELGIQAKKEGMKNGWTWELPPKVLKTNEDAHQKNMSSFGENEHLRQNMNNAPLDFGLQDYVDV